MVSNNIDNYKFGELEINDVCVSHLHDKNGENWFDDNAGALLLGITPRAYRKHVNNILNDSEIFGPISTKNLKTGKKGRPKRYVNFGMITMVAGRSRSDKAMSIVILAGNLLNEKYNQVQGYAEIPKPSREDKILSRAKKQQAKIRMRSDALYTELNFMNPSSERAKEILEEISELKPEELRINRQIKNIENCFGSLSRETSIRSQSKLLDFDDNSKNKLL